MYNNYDDEKMNVNSENLNSTDNNINENINNTQSVVFEAGADGIKPILHDDASDIQHINTDEQNNTSSDNIDPVSVQDNDSNNYSSIESEENHMDRQNNYSSSENQYNPNNSQSSGYSDSNNTDYNGSCNSYNPVYPSGTWRPESSYHYSYQTNSNIPNNKKPKKVRTKKAKKRNYSLGSLVAVGLCSALLCSILTAGGGYALLRANEDNTQPNSSTTSVTTPITQINATDETEELVPTIAEKCGPSVVGIRVVTTSSNPIFGSSDSASEGSGVIYTQDGYIITNYHVISTAVEGTTSGNNYAYGYFGFGYGSQSQPQSSSIEVYLPSDPDTAIDAAIVGYDVSADLAVLKINKTGLPVMEIADSDELKVGDLTVAIGNPGGLDFMGSVSKGIVSGLNRTLTTENGIEMNLIQTDAAINPGNSGGALVNSEGKLIGINNSKIAGDGYEGMGFAIPSNTVTEIVQRLIRQENEPTAYLGLTIDTNYDSNTLQRMGFPAGVVVFSVNEGSPADDAGIQQYDIITAINGTSITSYEMLNSEKNKYEPGETITVTVYRNGQTGDLPVTLGSSQAGSTANGAE